MKSSAELALYKRLIDLFIGAEMGAESGFISQTSQFPSIDHVVKEIIKPVKNENRDFSTNS